MFFLKWLDLAGLSLTGNPGLPVEDTRVPGIPPPCIFRFVLLGSFEKGSQAGVIRPVATGRMMVRVGTFAPGIRFDVMRPGACFTRAHCPKLEPLFEHDNSKIVARILQV